MTLVSGPRLARQLFLSFCRWRKDILFAVFWTTVLCCSFSFTAAWSTCGSLEITVQLTPSALHGLGSVLCTTVNLEHGSPRAALHVESSNSQPINLCCWRRGYKTGGADFLGESLMQKEDTHFPVKMKLRLGWGLTQKQGLKIQSQDLLAELIRSMREQCQCSHNGVWMLCSGKTTAAAVSLRD